LASRLIAGLEPADKQQGSSIMNLMCRGDYAARIAYDEEIDGFFGR
jgi:hypothetical protein